MHIFFLSYHNDRMRLSAHNQFVLWIYDETRDADKAAKQCMRYLRGRPSIIMIDSISKVKSVLRQAMNHVRGRRKRSLIRWLHNHIGIFFDREHNVSVEHMSDVVRYLLLHVFGGVWYDACSMVLDVVPIDEWIVQGYTMTAPVFADESFIKNRYFDPFPGVDARKASIQPTIENWFLWCQPNCDIMGRWAFASISQCRSIAEGKKTQADVFLRNVRAKPADAYRDAYLWTYTTFLKVAREVGFMQGEYSIRFDKSEDLIKILNVQTLSYGCFCVDGFLVKLTKECRTEVSTSDVRAWIEERL